MQKTKCGKNIDTSDELNKLAIFEMFVEMMSFSSHMLSLFARHKSSKIPGMRRIHEFY